MSQVRLLSLLPSFPNGKSRLELPFILAMPPSRSLLFLQENIPKWRTNHFHYLQDSCFQKIVIEISMECKWNLISDNAKYSRRDCYLLSEWVIHSDGWMSGWLDVADSHPLFLRLIRNWSRDGRSLEEGDGVELAGEGKGLRVGDHEERERYGTNTFKSCHYGKIESETITFKFCHKNQLLHTDRKKDKLSYYWNVQI